MSDCFISEHHIVFPNSNTLNNASDIDSEEYIEDIFSIEGLFSENKQELHQNMIKFRENMIRHTVLNSDDIYDDGSFDIDNYKNIDSLIAKFKTIAPPHLDPCASSLLTFSIEMNKNYGSLFKSSKQVVLFMTIQGNLLIWKESIYNKCSEKYSLEDITFKTKNEVNDLYRIEMIYSKHGYIYNSNATIEFDALSKENYLKMVKGINEKFSNKFVR
jgi:hypothetical protein